MWVIGLCPTAEDSNMQSARKLMQTGRSWAVWREAAREPTSLGTLMQFRHSHSSQSHTVTLIYTHTHKLILIHSHNSIHSPLTFTHTDTSIDSHTH